MRFPSSARVFFLVLSPQAQAPQDLFPRALAAPTARGEAGGAADRRRARGAQRLGGVMDLRGGKALTSRVPVRTWAGTLLFLGYFRSSGFSDLGRLFFLLGYWTSLFGGLSGKFGEFVWPIRAVRAMKIPPKENVIRYIPWKQMSHASRPWVASPAKFIAEFVRGCVAVSGRR